jgi:putative ABC transport system permease protein
MEYKNAKTVNTTATTGTKVGPQFKRTFPSVEEYTRTFINQGIIKYGEKVFDEQHILFADQPFFKIFSFKLVEGNAATALDAPDKMVLTKSMAKKYFGNDPDSYRDAINKTINAFGKDFTVSAICDDVPQNSQIKFDFVTQFLNLGNSVKIEKWWEANWITYLLVRDKKDISKLFMSV